MTPSRRWSSGRRLTVDGVDLRVVQGAKGQDDLRLDIWLGRWVPVSMSLAFVLVDFFAENERYLQVVNPHWRENGDRYFVSRCVSAWRDGWEAPARELREYQRRGLRRG